MFKDESNNVQPIFPSYFNDLNSMYDNRDSFSKWINKEYSNYKFKENESKVSSKGFEVGKQQKFISKYSYNSKGLLVYNSLGSGKTCSAILSGELYRRYTNFAKKIIVVAPTSIIPSFKSEIKGKIFKDKNNTFYLNGCINNTFKGKNNNDPYGIIKNIKILNNFTNDNGNKKVEAAFRIQEKQIDTKISNKWEFYSHQAFMNILKSQKPEDIKYKRSFLNTDKNESDRLIIIDEIHKLISEKGTYYEALSNFTKLYGRGNRFLLLTATPIYDKPFEVGLILNLLNPRVYFPLDKDGFNRLFNDNMALFYYMCRGYVAYFNQGDPESFAIKRVFNVYSSMSEDQSKKYNDIIKSEVEKIVKSENKNEKVAKLDLLNKYISTNKTSIFNFFSKSREYLNIPESFLERDDVKNVATKIHTIMEMIKKSDNNKIFVFSQFKKHGVLKIADLLEKIGYTRINERNLTDLNRNPKKRFTVWSGDVINKETFSNKILGIFNSKENDKGELLQIILGTDSITEGVSLKHVRDVHILEPWWNESKMNQVIGRAIRKYGHSRFPSENRVVNVFRHYVCGLNPSQYKLKILGDKSIDEYIKEIAEKKNKKTLKFDTILKQSAVDCDLNYHANKVRPVSVYECNFDKTINDLIINNGKKINPSTGEDLGNISNLSIDYNITEPVEVISENINCSENFEFKVNDSNRQLNKLQNITKKYVLFGSDITSIITNIKTDRKLKNFLRTFLPINTQRKLINIDPSHEYLDKITYIENYLEIAENKMKEGNNYDQEKLDRLKDQLYELDLGFLKNLDT